MSETKYIFVIPFTDLININLLLIIVYIYYSNPKGYRIWQNIVILYVINIKIAKL